MLERDKVTNGSILLVSDLETAPDDVPALARTVDAIRRSDIALRVVALAPSSDARTIFEGLLQQGGSESRRNRRWRAPELLDEATSELPFALVVLGGLFFLALAAHERFAGRLALPTVGRARRQA